MALPERIRVKLSSEAGGAVVMTPVVSQELPTLEIIERMLWAFGKEPVRIQELLRRGSMVSGASRFRWEPFEAEIAEIEEWLRRFPNPEPWRDFEPEQCFKICLRDQRSSIEITREAGSQKRLLKRHSFWSEMWKALPPPRYHDYSYKERSDHFTAEIDAAAARALREAASLLRYSKLQDAIEAARLHAADLFTIR
jgi:hypothetical protein